MGLNSSPTYINRPPTSLFWATPQSSSPNFYFFLTTFFEENTQQFFNCKISLNAPTLGQKNDGIFAAISYHAIVANPLSLDLL